MSATASTFCNLSIDAQVKTKRCTILESAISVDAVKSQARTVPTLGNQSSSNGTAESHIVRLEQAGVPGNKSKPACCFSSSVSQRNDKIAFG
jgi:hypothetical protein